MGIENPHCVSSPVYRSVVGTLSLDSPSRIFLLIGHLERCQFPDPVANGKSIKMQRKRNKRCNGCSSVWSRGFGPGNTRICSTKVYADNDFSVRDFDLVQIHHEHQLANSWGLGKLSGVLEKGGKFDGEMGRISEAV